MISGVAAAVGVVALGDSLSITQVAGIALVIVAFALVNL